VLALLAQRPSSSTKEVSGPPRDELYYDQTRDPQANRGTISRALTLGVPHCVRPTMGLPNRCSARAQITVP
jgi:hypothetical protein